MRESLGARVANTILISGRVCDSCQLGVYFGVFTFGLPTAVATRRSAKLKSDPAPFVTCTEDRTDSSEELPGKY